MWTAKIFVVRLGFVLALSSILTPPICLQAPEGRKYISPQLHGPRSLTPLPNTAVLLGRQTVMGVETATDTGPGQSWPYISEAAHPV